MTTQTEAIKLALEALEMYCEHGAILRPLETRDALKEALAKHEQGEPVVYDVRCDNCGGDGYDQKDNNYFCSSCEGSGFLEKPLYTTPQQRAWVGLTLEERDHLWEVSRAGLPRYNTFAGLVESKLREKNT